MNRSLLIVRCPKCGNSFEASQGGVQCPKCFSILIVPTDVKVIGLRWL